MTDWQDITFNVPKQIDEAVHYAISKAFKEAGLSPGTNHFHPVDGKAICCEDQDPNTNLEVTDLFVLKDFKIKEFEYCLAGKDKEAASLKVTRSENDAADQVSISLSKLNKMPDEISSGKLMNFVLSVKSLLQESSAGQSADTDGIARTFSQIRVSFDQELSRIKAMFDEKQSADNASQKCATEDLKASHQRATKDLEASHQLALERLEAKRDDSKRENQRLTREHRERVDQLEADHQRQQAEVLRDHQTNVIRINEDHAREVNRLKDNRERIDDFRKDFRHSIETRNKKTANRWVGFSHPVFIVHLLLLIGFGGVAWLSFYQLIHDVQPVKAGDTPIVLAVLFSLAFMITVASVTVWHRHWRELQDAREMEFLRMSIDVERSYLAVELALEAKSKSGEMSDELLEKLFVKTVRLTE